VETSGPSLGGRGRQKWFSTAALATSSAQRREGCRCNGIRRVSAQHLGSPASPVVRPSRVVVVVMVHVGSSHRHAASWCRGRAPAPSLAFPIWEKSADPSPRYPPHILRLSVHGTGTCTPFRWPPVMAIPNQMHRPGRAYTSARPMAILRALFHSLRPRAKLSVKLPSDSRRTATGGITCAHSCTMKPLLSMKAIPIAVEPLQLRHHFEMTLKPSAGTIDST
jgi:hypothetical protein